MSSGQSQSGMGSIVNAHMNVSETENEIRITAELPGVTEQDIDISLDDDVLTIRGEKKFEQSQGGEKENFHFVERSYGTFQRSLRLPYPIDPEQVRASFDNGVLTITLPKTAQKERTRRIQIQGSGSQGGQSGQARVASGGSSSGAEVGGQEGGKKGQSGGSTAQGSGSSDNKGSGGSAA